MLRKMFLLIVMVAVTQLRPLAQDASVEDKRGTLEDGSVYRNSTLGITVKLPGGWQLREKGVAHGAHDSSCTGPLCGDADIDVALAPKGSTSGRSLYLGAWKLSAEYKNRSRYPLKWFAQIMTSGSLGGSNWVPLGSLSAVQLDRRPAYRLLVAEPGEKEAKGFGYVSESNGYVFLLVGSVGSSADESDLQNAVERLEFSKAP
ncbi:MAG: hypothetical protein WCA76_04890 [Candidatus Sulfotelmatobacter sp.]|jgi:hypothetical protein